MIHSTATIRLRTAPAMISTTRSGRSMRPTGQRGIRLSARARAYDVMKLPNAATHTRTMRSVRSSRA